MLRTLVVTAAASFILSSASIALADDVPDVAPAPPIATTGVKPTSTEPDRAAEKKVDDEVGVVGTISLAAAMRLGSVGSEADVSCAKIGSSCSSSSDTGGAFLFSVGYMWKYLGFDVLGGFGIDGGEHRYTSLKGNQESYTTERIGGVAALRVRGQIQNENFRGVLALGPGIAFRAVGRADSFPGTPQDVGTYFSPAFTMDLNGQWRMGKSTSLVLGAMLWVEDAGAGVKGLVGSSAAGAASQYANQIPAGYATQAAQADFRMVSGMQASVMPYLGLQFGP